MLEVATEVWRRAVSTQPTPSSGLLVGAALVAAVLVLQPRLWRFARVLVTSTHEGGHAVVALLVGRRLSGIRLHSDTSGLTISSGRPTGPGVVAMLLAGYLAPALVGLGASALLLAGHALGLLWAFVLLLAAMLVKIRNLYGFAVVLAVGVGLVVLSWYASPSTLTTVATLLTWVLLLAAPKPVVELARQHRRGAAPHSDAAQLARLTRLPAGVWLTTFGALNLAGLAVGAGLLVPALTGLARAAGA